MNASEKGRIDRVIRELTGKRIKSIRKSKGLTQERLADKADISSRYLSRVELGLENPTFEFFIKLSLALDVQLAEIFDWEHEEGSTEELRRIIAGLLSGVSQEKLKMTAKLVRAIIR